MADTYSFRPTTVVDALGFDGHPLTDALAKALVACADATGGATGAALTVQLYQADGSTAVASARQVMVIAGATQYAPFPVLEASLTFGTATVGSIVASGGGWALVETSAAGAFACTATNTQDETLYFSVMSAAGGGSSGSKQCCVIGSNSDAAAWSA